MNILIGCVIGGVVGFAVYRFIGCASGTCPITSNPYASIIVFAIMGALAAGGK
jgi:hypothetical protein